MKGASQLLRSLGLSFARPTYTLKKANPTKQEKFRDETFPELKKLMNGKIGHLLFEDELMTGTIRQSAGPGSSRENSTLSRPTDSTRG